MHMQNCSSIQILSSIIFALFIICTSIKLTLTFKPLYYFEIENLDIEQQSGFSKNKIIENYDYIIDYMVNPEQQEFELPSISYSTYGQIHFQEVKNIFNYVDILMIITGIVSSICIGSNTKFRNFTFIKHTYYVLSIFIAILLASFIVNFNNSFILFHKVFFRNDYWIFNPKIDPVISILPQKFFYHSAILTLSIIIIYIILLKIIHEKLYIKNQI
ncbi:TIGR01906 family membrane protein [Clostridium sp. LBM24168]